MSHALTVRCSYDDPETASVIERAIVQEVDSIAGERSRAAVDRTGSTVVVEIDADDPRALRAAKHTWFSLLEAAEGAVTAVERTATVTDR